MFSSRIAIGKGPFLAQNLLKQTAAGLLQDKQVTLRSSSQLWCLP